jgi:hypothetical protein
MFEPYLAPHFILGDGAEWRERATCQHYGQVPRDDEEQGGNILVEMCFRGFTIYTGIAPGFERS